MVKVYENEAYTFADSRFTKQWNNNDVNWFKSFFSK